MADEPKTVYRFGSATMGAVSIEYGTYAEAAAIFRAHVQQDVAWCEIWEVTGNSAMQLCLYKRER